MLNSSSNTQVGHDIIIWKDGPLIDTVIKGKCGAIDNIDCSPPKVSER
jgi:hypothetical protein